MNVITPRSDAALRPLATFSVFAFNQETYIRATIESALAQTYSPLEIILSDDCSSDRTFEIMQDMARAYDGPHTVRLHRPPRNLGLVNHVLTVARQARGEYLIVNAGDDISYPDRTEMLVAAFLENGADCVNSHYDEINDSGAIVSRGNDFPPSPSTQRVFAKSEIARRDNGVVRSAIGFAASYRTDFWARLPLSPLKLNVEDGLATILLNCFGARLVTHDKALIAYRVHHKSLSLREAAEVTRESIMAREKKISNAGVQIQGNIDYVLSYLDGNGIAIEPPVRRELQRSVNYGRITAGFWEASFAERLRRLLRSRRKPEFLFVLPRLFGQEAFFLTKAEAMRAETAVRRLRARGAK